MRWKNVFQVLCSITFINYIHVSVSLRMTKFDDHLDIANGIFSTQIVIKIHV